MKWYQLQCRMKASKLVQRRIIEMVQMVTIISHVMNWIHRVWFHCPRLHVSIVENHAKKRLCFRVTTVHSFFIRYIDCNRHFSINFNIETSSTEYYDFNLEQQDCLDPPLTALPTTLWMCPNHAQQFVVSSFLL